MFDGNTAEFEGGALRLMGSHFEYRGSIFFGNHMASYYEGGALGMNNSMGQASFEKQCFTNNNNVSAPSITNTSNITFIGTLLFYNNEGGAFGGAVRSYNSNIVFSGLVHFERNQAFHGGAMQLGGASKLVLKPKFSVSFISNHARDSGGALYFRDSQCSLGSTAPIECFIIIDGPLASISNISLHFENNSAEFTGSILYGGQLDKCKPFFRSSLIYAVVLTIVTKHFKL